MRRLLPLLLTAVALPAQAAPVGLAAQAAPTQDADRLVALLTSDDLVSQLSRQMLDSYLRDEIGMSEAQKTMFAQNPALKEHVAGRLRGEMTPILRQELPSLRAQLAGEVRGGMSPQEIRDMLTFFSTRTGRKLLAGGYRGVGDSGAISPEEAEKAAISAMMRDLTPDDYSTLLTLGTSSAAQKFQTLKPRITEISRRWGEGVVARHQARLERVGEQAIVEYRGEIKG